MHKPMSVHVGTHKNMHTDTHLHEYAQLCTQNTRTRTALHTRKYMRVRKRMSPTHTCTRSRHTWTRTLAGRAAAREPCRKAGKRQLAAARPRLGLRQLCVGVSRPPASRSVSGMQTAARPAPAGLRLPGLSVPHLPDPTPAGGRGTEDQRASASHGLPLSSPTPQERPPLSGPQFPRR